MKVDIDIIKTVLKRNVQDLRTVAQIVEDIDSALKEEEMQKEALPPPVKKQFVILLSDPLGMVAAMVEKHGITGWIVQIPEDEDPRTARDRIIKAAYDFNVTPKGSRLPVESIGEACEAVPARIAKQHQLWIKTKEPLLLVAIENEIPIERP